MRIIECDECGVSVWAGWEIRSQRTGRTSDYCSARCLLARVEREAVDEDKRLREAAHEVMGA